MLLGRRFRISPNAFFQVKQNRKQKKNFFYLYTIKNKKVNRTTTEQMYDYCTKLAVNGVTDKQKTIGLDVCCGTGTLGKFFFKNFNFF